MYESARNALSLVILLVSCPPTDPHIQRHILRNSHESNSRAYEIQVHDAHDYWRLEQAKVLGQSEWRKGVKGQ